VARTGNITRAARELYISQPNLSKSIARLEEELGVPLFDHRKGHIELNDYGRIFLSSVDIAFSQLNTGTRTIRRLYESNQHILSLASNIATYLADVLPAFCTAHPEIGLRQIDCTTQQMIDRLLDHSIALGITNESIEHEHLEYQQLGSKSYILVMHQDNPLAASDAVSLCALEHETFISDLSRMKPDFLRKLCQIYGFSPCVGYEIQSTDLLHRLVESQRGIAIVPLGLACQILHRHPGHHLRLVRIQEELPRATIGIARHCDFQNTKASLLFEDYVHSCLAQEEALIREMGYDLIP
jgi:DNA-binding transcriptional LysR family regulator